MPRVPFLGWSWSILRLAGSFFAHRCASRAFGAGLNLGCLLRLGCRGSGGGFGCIRDHCDHSIHLDSSAFRKPRLAYYPRGRGRDLSVYFVGRDLKQRLVLFNGVSSFFEPARNRTFKNRLAHLGHRNFNRHGRSLSQSGNSRTSGSIGFGEVRFRIATETSFYCAHQSPIESQQFAFAVLEQHTNIVMHPLLTADGTSVVVRSTHGSLSVVTRGVNMKT